MKHILTLVFLISLTACLQNDDDTINCTDIFVSGLNVAVRDATTNALLSDGVTVFIEDGDYNEELVFVSNVFFGAGERPGTYTITVSGEGYATEIAGPVEVFADECHVITQEIEINLMPI